jgi:FtsP/CotA-like multicopper oxidase with cupredoxin domain
LQVARLAAGARAICALATGAIALAAAPVPARAADPPPFDVRSTPAAPCGTGTPPPGHVAPELRPTAAGLALTVRQDGSRLCYVANGVADAPVLRVRQGADFSITLRNEIDDPAAIEAAVAPGKLQVPNERVSHVPGFYEVVPGMQHPVTGATNLHLHGFAVPPVAPQDDVLTVCVDPATGPASCGRRAFTYRWHVPADMPEGLYWYHPHVHGEVQAQMLMGLAGAIVVEGPEDDARRAAGIGERLLVVRQTQDLDAGRAPAASMTAAAPEGPAASSARALPDTAIDTAHELLCTTNAGIDQLSLNGTPVPLGDAPDPALARYEIAPGGREVWRVLNAATDAFLDLALVDADGHPLPLQVLARDGSPLRDDAGRRLRPPPTLEPLAVPPAGRIELLVAAPPPGVQAYLVTHAVDTGCSGDRLPERRLAVLAAAPGASAAAGPDRARAAKSPPRPTAAAKASSVKPAPAPASTRTTAAARPDFFSGVIARRTDRTRVIAFAEYPRPGSEDRTDFYIVERRPGARLVPYMMGDPPTITVDAGTTEEWVIENWTNELHTFHIHQLHFRVLEIDGEPVAQPPLLDVVEVPYATAAGYHAKDGPVRPGRVRVKMTFPAALAGDIPFHCHLVDHEDNGMMAVLRIVPPARRH